MTAGWPSILDEIEHRLAQAQKGMSEGLFAFEPIEIPPSVGPVPPDCRTRVSELHALTVELAQTVEAAMAGVSANLSRRTSAVTATQPPSYIDRRA